MRISYWSSYVCSSDLGFQLHHQPLARKSRRRGAGPTAPAAGLEARHRAPGVRGEHAVAVAAAARTRMDGVAARAAGAGRVAVDAHPALRPATAVAGAG